MTISWNSLNETRSFCLVGLDLLRDVDCLNTGRNGLLYAVFVVDVSIYIVIHKQVVQGGFNGSI